MFNPLKPTFFLSEGRKFNGLILILLFVISLAHLFRLASVPVGFYLDETSIGYNAALIAKTGTDEYGVHFPIYFKAFGEYKNPIYVYTAALIFKLFGVSEFNLRFTSFLFYFLGLIATFLLASKIFSTNKIVQVYLLISFGFLPQFFTTSRLSFEVISQLAFIATAFLLVWASFHEPGPNKAAWIKAAVCGLILGGSVYTYSTARLLSFLTFVSIWVFYLKRDNLKKLLILSVTFSMSLIPYILFAFKNPSALIGRFDEISYISSDASVVHKIATFITNYCAYWSLNYLVHRGDAILRHSIGFGGIIFSVTLLLFLLGMVSLITNKQLFFNRYNLFLLINLLMAPIAAALTTPDTPHALRSLLLGFYILIISCYGLKFITEFHSDYHRHTLIAAVFAGLLLEILAYQANYFIFYPAISEFAMKGYDFKGSLQEAINENPKEVVVYDPDKVYYTDLGFYCYQVVNPNHIPLKAVQDFIPVPGTCYLFYYKDAVRMEKNPSYSFIELEKPYQLNPIEKLFRIKTPQIIIKLRCYKNSS
jgi:hypothetical protein